MKLLVADDEEIIRKGVAKYIKLHTDRYQPIYEAENGQEAIDLILKYHPDILLLDVQMPLKSGIDVMREVSRAGLDPLIVVLSGYDEFKYAQQAMRLGAREYLLKPVRAADILTCLDRLSEKHLAADGGEEEGDSQNQFIKRAGAYIREHYMESISLDDMAAELGITRSYVSTLFTQHMGCGFVEYLNGVRVDRACTYLEQSYFKTYEIAYKVGFKDEKYFSKVFKKIKGVSPREYRISKKGAENETAIRSDDI